nr:lipase a [Quercus suber]
MLLVSRIPVLLLAGLAALSARASPTTSPTPIPPSQDPWYNAPEHFESAAPGSVLRVRAAVGNLTTVFNQSSAAYNILYRTTDARYGASWAVTTLFVPRNRNSSALLSYQIPYNSVDVDASPTYALYAASEGIVLTDIQTALNKGWYVNVPDFEGPLASFGLGIQEGHATLDAVRAVLNSGFGLSSRARYALWGYSGGSIASEWAAELQGQYAPELNLAGVALGGLVSNLSSAMLDHLSGTMWAGLFPSLLVGLTTQYPDLEEYVVTHLKPERRSEFFAVKHMDIAHALTRYAGQDMFSYFANGRKDIESPAVQSVLSQQGIMGYHGVPTMPLFIYKAVHDEITPIEDTDRQIDRYCGVGANILYERNALNGHSAEENNGDSHAFAWLATVLEGTLYQSGCTIRNVSWNVTYSPLRGSFGTAHYVSPQRLVLP